MNLKISKRIGHRYAVAAAITLGLFFGLGVARADEAIPIANFTSFTDKALSDYLTENLNPELKREIAQKKLAFFALGAVFDGKQACYATVGLSENASKGRNPRLPDSRYSSFARMSDETWAEGNCVQERLKVSIDSLNTAKLEEVLKGIERTTALDGKRDKKRINTKKVSLVSIGLTDEYIDSLFDLMIENNFSEAFDYRAVQGFVFSEFVNFSKNDYMCVAFAGITGTQSNIRNPRWPGNTVTFVRLQTGGNTNACLGIVAKAALGNLLKKKWTDQGILKNYALGHEDGIPFPNAQKALAVQIKMDTLNNTRVITSNNNATNRLRCTNNCVNGSCLRKFSNGRTERWQAPRVMNPLTQNWEWDITTHACGL